MIAKFLLYFDIRCIMYLSQWFYTNFYAKVFVSN